MAKIKVICGGCGIEYTDANGNARHALKTPESGPFMCDDAQAARLVSLGVAEYVEPVRQEEPDQAPAQGEGDPDNSTKQTGGTPDDENQESEKVNGHLDPEELEKMEYNALKKLAADMGVVPEGKRRVDYIAALSAVEVEVEDEDNDLPPLGAADPE